MTLPKDVQDALDARDSGYLNDSRWEILRAHLLSQDAEIDRQKSITNIICDDVSAALLRAGFEDIDGPGEAIDIIRERAELAESRLAAADALLREIDRNGVLSQGVRARITDYLQGAGDEA